MRGARPSAAVKEEVISLLDDDEGDDDNDSYCVCPHCKVFTSLKEVNLHLQRQEQEQWERLAKQAEARKAAAAAAAATAAASSPSGSAKPATAADDTIDLTDDDAASTPATPTAAAVDSKAPAVARAPSASSSVSPAPLQAARTHPLVPTRHTLPVTPLFGAPLPTAAAAPRTPSASSAAMSPSASASPSPAQTQSPTPLPPVSPTAASVAAAATSSAAGRPVRSRTSNVRLTEPGTVPATTALRIRVASQPSPTPLPAAVAAANTSPVPLRLQSAATAAAHGSARLPSPVSVAGAIAAAAPSASSSRALAPPPPRAPSVVLGKRHAAASAAADGGSGSEPSARVPSPLMGDGYASITRSTTATSAAPTPGVHLSAAVSAPRVAGRALVEIKRRHLVSARTDNAVAEAFDLASLFPATAFDANAVHRWHFLNPRQSSAATSATASDGKTDAPSQWWLPFAAGFLRQLCGGAPSTDNAAGPTGALEFVQTAYRQWCMHRAGLAPGGSTASSRSDVADADVYRTPASLQMALAVLHALVWDRQAILPRYLLPALLTLALHPAVPTVSSRLLTSHILHIVARYPSLLLPPPIPTAADAAAAAATAAASTPTSGRGKPKVFVEAVALTPLTTPLALPVVGSFEGYYALFAAALTGAEQCVRALTAWPTLQPLLTAAGLVSARVTAQRVHQLIAEQLHRFIAVLHLYCVVFAADRARRQPSATHLLADVLADCDTLARPPKGPTTFKAVKRSGSATPRTSATAGDTERERLSALVSQVSRAVTAGLAAPPGSSSQGKLPADAAPLPHSLFVLLQSRCAQLSGLLQ